jgi:hypothetical protein
MKVCKVWPVCPWWLDVWAQRKLRDVGSASGTNLYISVMLLLQREVATAVQHVPQTRQREMRNLLAASTAQMVLIF